ncbi:hypothetical protein ACQPZQ_02380 [Pseudonocardia sp. CA-142604]|uniref:hypothetical protein n=1 Tax=Pseudonocardia sp. CA-142604 TaxID=3240024 RepID=UPI003D8BDC47
MAGPWGGHLHTLAQLAHRAGISESRARGLFPAKLPPPDRHDAGGRPLWWSATIDAWCAGTGRIVNDDALWLFQTKDAETTPVELVRGVVELPGYGNEQVKYYAVVWDTPHGHVIYLMPIGEWHHPDGVAHRAASLIEPRWWSDAIVIMPFPEELAELVREHAERDPTVYIYRLTTEPKTVPERSTRAPATRAAGSPFDGIRRWFASLTEDARDDPGNPDTRQAAKSPRAEWVTSLSMSEVARPLGAPLPLWINGTLSEATVTRSLAYAGTVTVPDKTTGWPGVQNRVENALKIDLAGDYPGAWAVLAVDARQRLEQIRAAHAALPDSAPGWQLMARPAKPQVPLGLETRLTVATLAENPEQVAAELTALRDAVADLTVDDPQADVYTEAIKLLTLQLNHHLRQQGAVRRSTDVLGNELAAVLNHTTVPFSAPWQGSVIEEWKSTLTPVADIAAALRRRRLVDLLRSEQDLDPQTIAAIYQDRHGHYVVVPTEEDEDRRIFEAEWPVDLDAVSTWNEHTVIAADHVHQATALLALTPTEDGRMRVDPVPVPEPQGHRQAFAYGYPGGTPSTTYRALVRCALPDEHDNVRLLDFREKLSAEQEPPVSELWDALVTTRKPLRLRWPDIQRWARADLATSTALRPGLRLAHSRPTTDG